MACLLLYYGRSYPRNSLILKQGHLYGDIAGIRSVQKKVDKIIVMETKSKDIVGDLLIEQLKSLGVEVDQIPYVIRDIDNSFIQNPSINLVQINDYLLSLGWNDLCLDYRTYELAKAYFEDAGTTRLPRFIT